MKIGDKWRRDKEINNFDHNKILVLLYGTQFILKTSVFLFETPADSRMWVQGLQHLMQEIHFTSHPLLIERWLRKEFYSTADSQTTRVSMKHLKPFVQARLQYKITSKELQSLVKEEHMPYESFAEAYKKLIHVHSLFSDRFDAYSTTRSDPKEGKMIKIIEFNNYLRFLVSDQKDEMGNCREIASEYLRRYIRDVEISRDTSEPHLTEKEFVDYLFSRENSIWNPSHNIVCQDMDQPLCNYWIASSHNTYLTGDQIKSESSLDAYARALLMGCRCIELDCWDGPKRGPSGEADIVIYHGHTMTTKIQLRDVLNTIKEHAFTTSDYPVILSIEDNCSVPAQRVLASDLKEILSEYLLISPVDKNETCLPSPNQMRNKIILKHKKLKTESETAAEAQLLDDSWQDQDLLSLPDFLKKGVLFMKDPQGNWHPHIFVLFSTKLCYTADSTVGLNADESFDRFEDVTQEESMIEEEQGDRQMGMPGVKPDEMHITEEWFHGKISREEATKLLKLHAPTMGDGLFLVRESNTFIGDFSLSFWFRNEVHHCRIRTKMIEGEKKFFFLEAKTVDTLYELISFYTRYPLTTPRFKAILLTACPQPSPHLGEPWFAGNINKLKAEEWLNAYREDGAFLIRYSGSDPDKFVLSLRVDGQIWHNRLKREGRIFLVNQTIFENLNLLVKYYQDHEVFRGICLKFPVNEESIEKYCHSDMTYTPEGCYMDLNAVEHELIYEAIQNYTGKNQSELSFPIGAQIPVIRKTDNQQMCQGRFAGKVGWFPSSCVRQLGSPGGEGDSNSGDHRDYGSIELAGCVIVREPDPERPFKFRISQTTSHWREQKLELAADTNEEMEEWFNILVDGTKQADKKRTELRGKEKVMRIASELSDLVVYCQAVPYGSAGNFYEMCSFSEAKHDKLVEKGLVKFNHKHVSRVYPVGTRVTSTNFIPCPMWNTGCHMVALNYQTPDRSMQLNQGKFLANGRCGYVLKPKYMLGSCYDPDNADTCIGAEPVLITIMIIAGRHLCRKDTTRGGIASPVVEVEIIGLPSDSNSHKTRTISSDGLHPVWNEVFQFNVKVPELALLRFYVEDGDFLGPRSEPFIGQAVFPLNSIRSGYRSVILRNAYSEELELSSLLVHMDIQKDGSAIEQSCSNEETSPDQNGYAANRRAASINSPPVPSKQVLTKNPSSAAILGSPATESPSPTLSRMSSLAMSTSTRSSTESPQSTDESTQSFNLKKKSSSSSSKLRNLFNKSGRFK